RADPATDAADRRVAFDRGRNGRAQWRSIRHRARPWRRASDHLSAGARALFRRAAARLRLFHARAAAATVRAGIGIHFSNELHGPGGGLLVQASENPDADLCWHQPATVLPGRILLAARSDPEAGSRRALRVPGRFRDRRTRAHRPAWR